MSNKILIPIIVVLLLTVGGLSTYILVQKPSSSVVNSTVSSTAISSLTNTQIKSELSEQLSIVKDVLAGVQPTKSEMQEKMSMIKDVLATSQSSQSSQSSQTKGTTIVKGYIQSTSAIGLLDVPPTICFVSATKEYCNFSFSEVVRDNKDNILEYISEEIPFGKYSVTINFGEFQGFGELPQKGFLKGTDKSPIIINQSDFTFDVNQKDLDQLPNKKRDQVQKEFGNRPDCIKKTDFYYKCSGVGSPKPTN